MSTHVSGSGGASRRTVRALSVAVGLGLAGATVTVAPAVAAPPEAWASAPRLAQATGGGQPLPGSHRGPVPVGPRVAAGPDDGLSPVTGAGDGSAAALTTARSVAKVAPGVSLTRRTTYDAQGFVHSYLLTADLSGPTRPQLLTGPLSDPRPLTALAAKDRAVAATNGDFFTITTTNAPLGPAVRGSELLKAGPGPATTVGVGTDRVARLADLVLEGEAKVGTEQLDLAALNPVTLPADGVVVWTPDWGPGDRTLVPHPSAVTEVVVSGGHVAEVHDALTSTPVPADGYVLAATGTEAAALAAAASDGAIASVTYRPRADVPSPFQMALGAHEVLVRDGHLATIDDADKTNAELKPRTALGWKDGGRTLLLLTVDGSSSVSRGLTGRELGQRMLDAGATDAVMLDGGGSSEMVARRPGDPSAGVVNVPSDGNERLLPEGVGLVAPEGSGRLHGIDVRLRSDRMFPGLSRDVSAAGYDETLAPAPLDAPRWHTVPDDLAKPDAAGVLRGDHPGTGLLEVRSGTVHEQVPVRTLGQLDRISADVPALSLPVGTYRDITVTGRDAEGFSAPIEPRDVHASYDASVVDVTPTGDGTLRVQAGADADGKGTLLTLDVQGHTVTVPVTVGLSDRTLASFDDAAAWKVATARTKASVAPVSTADRPGASAGDVGLRLTYDLAGPSGTAAAYAVAPTPIVVPPGAQRLALWVKGDGRGHWLRAQMRSQGTTNVPFTFTLHVDWTGWKRVEGEIPTGFTEPITVERIYLVETDQSARDAGSIVIDDLDARVGVALDVPDTPDQPDPAVVEQSALPTAGWRFAVISDTHVNSDGGTTSYAYQQTARALDEIAAAHPDFVLISGDGVDNDRPADFALFQQLLADHLPADIPVRWAVGNHESGANAGGTLDQFQASTGRPTRQVFDHEGTRFILLNSTLGSLRLSDYSQLPWLREQLRSAETDPSVGSVVVAVHHPVDDPTGTGASQLSDPQEGQLLYTWLADFRARSGKQVALINGHAHDAKVERVDGVLVFHAPVVGKVPYGDAAHGGFSGWSLVDLRPDLAHVSTDRPDPAGLGWFSAQVRPLLTSATVQAPDALPVGASSVVSATAVDAGMQGRVVPMRFPLSVTWSGSEGLVVVDSDRERQTASRLPGTVAVLDRRSLTLYGVRPGDVEITVTSGSVSASTRVSVT